MITITVEIHPRDGGTAITLHRRGSPANQIEAKMAAAIFGGIKESATAAAQLLKDHDVVKQVTELTGAAAVAANAAAKASGPDVSRN